MSFFPTEAEQIEILDSMAEDAETAPFAFLLPQDVLDTFLRYGTRFENGRLGPLLDIQKGKTLEYMARYWPHFYHGGSGIMIGNAPYSAWYDETGLHIARGRAARYSNLAQTVAWEDAIKRVAALLEAGEYATQLEILEAGTVERSETAKLTLFFYRNVTDAGRALLPGLQEIQKLGFQEAVYELAEKLDDSAYAAKLAAQMRAFAGVYAENPEIMRFRHHQPEEVADALEDLLLPHRAYESRIAEAPEVERFITEDEIDETLRLGSGVDGGKQRIADFFSESHTSREQADFLKKEYGIGGRSHAVSDAPGSSEWHDAKGIGLKKQGCPDVQLSWAKVARRINALIRKDRYWTEEQRKEAVQRESVENVEDEALTATSINRREGEREAELPAAERLEEKPIYIEETPAAEMEEDHLQLSAPALERQARIEYDFRRGDVLYLDDKPFEVVEAGAFSVRLREQGSDTLLLRAESRESLARLLPLDERNARYLEAASQALVQSIETERANTPVPSGQNFRITDEHLGESGAKTRYARNIEAIRTLKRIEAEDRGATGEEQEILSRYVGWGGLPNAFDEGKAEWAREYAELKALLTPEEYESARASTLNAHYTSPVVIRAIYDAVQQMGFRTGNVLEPSCGIGNFFGMLPEAMQGSRFYGVELDSVTGRIARQLYPQANIAISGFEKTSRKDFFDLAVGNVPFGSYKVNDRAFNRHNFLIHDYFFAKTLDQVRAGGVIAFITSKGTMDKQSPEARRYIAERAELLGAIRLPNNAFKGNAGTEVTSDILFLQKRERPIAVDEPWIHLGRTEDGIPVNSYFVDHPEMILGRMAWDKSMYGNEKETTCEPIPGAELAQQLSEAVRRIHGRFQETALPDLAEGEEVRESLPADPGVRNYSFTVVDGQVFFRQDSVMVRSDLSPAAQERVKGMIAIRDCVRRLMEAQLEEAGDAEIHALQSELNALYDAFTAKYGLLNARANRLAFADDSSYYLLCSLENVNDKGELESKADMFTKRTIRQRRSVEHTDTAVEALAVSIGERAKVDLDFMARLTSKGQEELIRELRGVIFRVPMKTEGNGNEVYVTADEYLSGNVREKLRAARLAAQADEAFLVNVQALEKAQPADLDASEIDVRLGATWVDEGYIKQFAKELFDLPFYLDRSIQIRYSPITAEWRVEGKSVVRDNVAVNMTYGTDRAGGLRILEDTLNLRDVRIYELVEDEDGKERRVLNQKETTLAQQKQQAIKDAFRDWIWKDPQRRHDLVQKYNELFNSVRPREYDGSHIVFSGMNPEISLREHQRNAIAHVLYGGNTLLAHEVGAGKTYEMAAAAMESKRLGLCQKSMFVVPNHLTEQWASEFLRLYPGANLLVTTKKDFEKANRKKFCARIATGDYDAVIIGHSQFERIPISRQRQERLLRGQIEEITEGIEALKYERGERFTIKQMEATRKSLEDRLSKLLAEEKKDDVVTFEELGVDRLFVDEAQAYKNLFLYTKMRNVAGLSTSEAQKSSDMFMKCQYLDELTGGKGVIFATGTPVSNSMTELYTMQRYLQYGTLRKMNLTHFDAWASTFGETTTAIELAPEGTGYRARTRFAKFFNLPELMNVFKEIADIKTSDQLNLPVPEAKFQTVVVQPSEIQQEMVASLSERAAQVHACNVEPTIDNMLKIVRC